MFCNEYLSVKEQPCRKFVTLTLPPGTLQLGHLDVISKFALCVV